MRIVFMGTPDFAVAPLRAILEAGHEVAAVVTQPDKPQGRKMLLTPPPVKVFAQLKNIPVLQPATLKDERVLKTVGQIAPDAVVVAAYGKILPKNLLRIPKYGCINIHASLLPKYRGAAPIQAAILNGEENTGVTAMQTAEGIDTGDILLQETTPITRDENAQSLTARLSKLGAGLIVKTLKAAENGTLRPRVQDNEKSSYAPMITKKMSPVNWSRSACEIHNQVRGLFPWPAASAVLRGHTLKICGSRVAANQKGGIPGMILPEKEVFLVCCGGGTILELLDVQPESGKKMRGGEFLRGHPVQGMILG